MKSYFFIPAILATVNIVADNYAEKPQTDPPTSSNMPFQGLPCDTACSNWGINVIGEWLYFIPQEESLVYAYKGSDIVKFESNEGLLLAYQAADGSYEAVSPGYSSGFRVGLGWDTTYDCWETDLVWTRFWRSHASEEIPTATKDVIGTNVIVGNRPRVITDTSGSVGAAEEWKLRLDQIDLDLSRKTFFGEKLALAPTLALRSLWIRQDNEIVSDILVPNRIDDGTLIEMKNNFWGIGPKFALDMNWKLFYGFSVYGNIGFSSLWGLFRTNINAITVDEEFESFSVAENVGSYNFHAGRFTLDTGIGLMWNYQFCSSGCSVRMHAGWEEHIYPSQSYFHMTNELFPSNPSAAGTLSIQGLTLGGSIIF